MPLIVIGALVGLAFLAIWLGYVPPLGTSTLIRIRNGVLVVRHGRVKARAQDHIADILREAGVTHGFIAITRQKRVTFSRRIPPIVHQNLRNVLLNQ